MDIARMPKEGDRFGNWIIRRTLDKGGMGMVYLVHNPTLRVERALKVLDPAVAEKNHEFVDRFNQEASLVCGMHSPNLVEVYDAGCDGASGFYYIVMEYLGGGTLRDRMRQQGPMPWREALSIVRQVALALEAVSRRNSVHRDIKPENIMFTSEGVVKLADFGIAKAVRDDAETTLKTMPAQVFGTPAYMSPEQVKDASSVDARADIWSLGVVLFEMLAGARPYPSGNLVEVAGFLLSGKPFPDIRTFAADNIPVSTCRQAQDTLETLPTMATQASATMPGPQARSAPIEVPDGIAELLLRMCEKDVARRMASSEEVVEAIDKLLGQTESALGKGTACATEVGMKKNWALRIVCLALLPVVVSMGVLAYLKMEERDMTAGGTTAGDLTLDDAPSPVEIVTNRPPPEPKLPPITQDVLLFEPQEGSADDILRQLDVAIRRRPKHIRVSLSCCAQRNEWSLERYEHHLLVPAVERLRSSGVIFSLVPGPGAYGQVVQDVGKRLGCDLD